MVKKGFQILGIIFVICFSFFYTEKAVTVLKEHDPIMQKILETQSKYNILPIDAMLVDKYYIIPGYNGIKVDVDRSFNSMKRLGEFNENFLVYRKDKPKTSINKIYDRYIISGNKVKNTVSLVFKVKIGDDLTPLISILQNNKVKATFFLDGKWMEENIETIKEMYELNHELANYGYDDRYNNDLFVWTNNKLKQVGRRPVQYCYVEEDDFVILDLCSSYKMYTVKPSIVTKNYPFNEIKANIDAGSIISFDVNDIVIKELTTIINFIKSKGYKIDTLNNHLSEYRD
jgi:peptidoglycan/xylan/chitin deacetylase (PgdA/CDA1 family)